MRIQVRPLSGPSEFEGAEEVQISAWGMGSRDRAVTPKEMMIAIHDNGGLALGAFDGDTLVGFALLFPGYNGKRVYMYSHQTGVLKEYQSRGVGYLLKQKQREFALKSGIDLIAWTFDPLIARNAYFNFTKLGTIARRYLVDYYGPMQDPANGGWPTDRFLCEWLIEPRQLSSVRSYARGPLRDAHVVIAKSGEEPYPVCRDWQIDLSVRRALLDIPSDVVKLKAADPEKARRWREATREAFLAYFSAGFTAIALIEDGGSKRYLLMKTRLPKSPLAVRIN